jgi:KDO2-lipid IV(A) lauroyltransferase
LAKFLGRTVYRFNSRARGVGLANLDCVFGNEMSAEEKRDLIIRSLQHNSLTMLDIFWFSRNPRQRIEKYVHWDDPPDFLNEGRPVICVTAHYGNWEVLGQKVVTTGAPLMSVAHPLINAYADKIFIDIRIALGQEISSSDGALRKMLNRLKKGGNIAIVMDQNTKPRRGGVFVNFFDIPVPVSSAPASLALKTDALITFGFCSADDDGHYHIKLPNHIREFNRTGNTKADTLALTQEISRLTEEQIRRDPSPWMWSYKRWSHIQPGSDPGRYPSYALPMLSKEL